MNDTKKFFGLYNILKKKYGSRLNRNRFIIEYCHMSLTLDGNDIFIIFKPNEFLLISATKEILTELYPILREIMNDEEPICGYDLQLQGNNDTNDYKTSIEWDVKDHEERLRYLINNRDRAFPYSKIHNIRLFNSKNVEDYLDARVYGEYPGCIESEQKRITR